MAGWSSTLTLLRCGCCILLFVSRPTDGASGAAGIGRRNIDDLPLVDVNVEGATDGVGRPHTGHSTLRHSPDERGRGDVISAVHRRQGSDRHEHSCGKHRTCDLQTHYCDSVNNLCMRCEDDCHPGRIAGNKAAIADCHRNCAVWYAELSERATANQHKKTSDVQLVEIPFAIIVFLTVGMVATIFFLAIITIVLVYRTCFTNDTSSYKTRDIYHQRYTVGSSSSSSSAAVAFGNRHTNSDKSSPISLSTSGLPPSYDSCTFV